MPTALVINPDVDMSTSVSRPRHRFNGGSGTIHRWTGTGNKANGRPSAENGLKEVQRLPFPGHQVLSVWGAATPNYVGKRGVTNEEPEPELTHYNNRKQSDNRPDGSHTRRVATTDRTGENMAHPLGRRVKLVFLKDSGDLSKWGRVKETETAVESTASRSSCVSADDISASGDDSSSSPGTLSPAEALTMSRYSSRAMSSSYLCSASSTTTASSSGRNTSASGIEDVTEDDSTSATTYRAKGGGTSRRYYATSDANGAASSGQMTSSTGTADSNNEYSSYSIDEGVIDWRHRGASRTKLERRHKRNGLGADRANLRSAARQMDNEDSNGNGKGASVVPVSENTSRTCSNELLNVISIDDDKLRYRHFSNGSLVNDSKNYKTSLLTVMTKTSVGANRRRASSVTKSRNSHVTGGRRQQQQQQQQNQPQHLTTTYSSDGGGVASGRRRLLRAVDSALGPTTVTNSPRTTSTRPNEPNASSAGCRAPEPGINYGGSMPAAAAESGRSRTLQAPPTRRTAERRRRSSPVTLDSTSVEHHQQGTSAPQGEGDVHPTGSPNVNGGPTFFSMNRTLRQAVDNVWIEERRRPIVEMTRRYQTTIAVNQGHATADILHGPRVWVTSHDDGRTAPIGNSSQRGGFVQSDQNNKENSLISGWGHQGQQKKFEEGVDSYLMTSNYTIYSQEHEYSN